MSDKFSLVRVTFSKFTETSCESIDTPSDYTETTKLVAHMTYADSFNGSLGTCEGEVQVLATKTFKNGMISEIVTNPLIDKSEIESKITTLVESQIDSDNKEAICDSYIDKTLREAERMFRKF